MKIQAKIVYFLLIFALIQMLIVLIVCMQKYLFKEPVPINLLDTNLENIAAIRIENNNGAISLKQEDSWYIDAPSKPPLDYIKLKKLVASLNFIDSNKFVFAEDFLVKNVDYISDINTKLTLKYNQGEQVSFFIFNQYAFKNYLVTKGNSGSFFKAKINIDLYSSDLNYWFDNKLFSIYGIKEASFGSFKLINNSLLNKWRFFKRDADIFVESDLNLKAVSDFNNFFADFRVVSVFEYPDFSDIKDQFNINIFGNNSYSLVFLQTSSGFYVFNENDINRSVFMLSETNFLKLKSFTSSYFSLN